jgi:hypothetical protein
MNTFAKLRAIRDVIQQDVGNRGLARDSKNNLFSAFPDDFEIACESIAATPNPSVLLVTGFHIADADPPACETDGPLGVLFIIRTLFSPDFKFRVLADGTAISAIAAGLRFLGLRDGVRLEELALIEAVYRMAHQSAYPEPTEMNCLTPDEVVLQFEKSRDRSPFDWADQIVAIERVGPSQKDGNCYSMRGRDISQQTRPAHVLFELAAGTANTIGIGDGGNEIGMGKIPHETIVKNIPNGDLIHCRVATDHLIVAGVSNWGAYALAAGVALLRGAKLPVELFDPERERAILQTMVDAGPLVDGVTGKQTATVDGLSWEEYIRPLQQIGKIVEA